MAVKHYPLFNNERSASGYTDLFVVKAADMTSFSALTINLCALAIGDIVWQEVLLEVKTLVTGPSVAPTASVGVTGAVTQMIGVSLVKSGNQYFTPAAAAAAYPTVAASKFLVLDLQAGGGDGAAATAGEIWVYARISRVAERNTVRG